MCTLKRYKRNGSLTARCDRKLISSRSCLTSTWVPVSFVFFIQTMLCFIPWSISTQKLVFFFLLDRFGNADPPRGEMSVNPYRVKKVRNGSNSNYDPEPPPCYELLRRACGYALGSVDNRAQTIVSEWWHCYGRIQETMAYDRHWNKALVNRRSLRFVWREMESSRGSYLRTGWISVVHLH